MLLSRIRAIILAGVVLANAGCSTVAYYGQAVAGHLRIMAASRDIDDLVSSGNVDEQVAARLQLIQAMRRFAVTELGLPDNDSYSRYARLDREFVVWNVFAAPEFSTRAVTWCFAIVGCVGYRGYFAEADALGFARAERAAGRDVFVGGVDAYSTLGRLSDPVLSTFIDYSEPRTAALLFHELTHQLVYVDDDTVFNESFATAVADAGVHRWLRHRRADDQLDRFAAQRAWIDDATRLMLDYRARLDAVYVRDIPADAMRAEKTRLLDALYAEYLRVAAGHGIAADRIALSRDDVNNALVSSFDLYHRFVPAFAELLKRHDGDFHAFYDAVRSLAALPRPERHAELETLMLDGEVGT